ncbi:FKBP-type peptidyl-prolyl cis-trans isomerase [Handroanthus impetiginosus]|uniref:peptidylprolyl isomerase n=1 Tax=Handroanthus impetiginosus TaxID=429701 RepID=A0A2G9I1L5_9LAMI|nr:FKBP-type peptidyl-prolyl cis-trans isomerase [Handroanthus impetiginosus]
MASSLLVSPPFLCYPVKKSNYLTNSQSLSPQPYSNLPPAPSVAAAKVPEQRLTRSTLDSTDYTLTRRFGFGAGLALVGSLSLPQQIQTRLQVPQHKGTSRNVEKEEEVVLPNGIRYYDLKVGRGASPGDVVGINVRGSVLGSGQVFVDTFRGGKKNKAMGVVMGTRPYGEGICEGVEYVIRHMKAGGKRRVIIPPSLGFGEKGADFGEGVQVPPSATLEYVVEVQSVSMAPPPSYI